MTNISVNDIAKTLKKDVDVNGIVDVSRGVEEKFGVSKPTFRKVLDLLKEEGYKVYYRVFLQEGTDKKTAIKILASPDLTYRNVYDRTKGSAPQELADESGVEYTKDQEAIDRAAYLEHERAIDTIKKVEAREKGE